MITLKCRPMRQHSIHTVHGLKAFQASFNVPKTALAIILCSTVVLFEFNYVAKATHRQRVRRGNKVFFHTLSGCSFATALVYLILT